jgi:hypothetical protein
MTPRPFGFLLTLAVGLTAGSARGDEQHLLYVAAPGVLHRTGLGGVGVLIFDADHGHKFVRRLPTWEVPPGGKAENVRGIAAHAETARLCVSTLRRVGCFDLVSGEKRWERRYEGGADRIALSPDGKTLYVPSLEGPDWTVVDARTGAVTKKIETRSGAHNTIFGFGGTRVYLAGVQSPILFVAETEGHTIVKKVGPFGAFIRPFTINGSETLAFLDVDDLLGFEVGDLVSGKLLHRVEVAGFRAGPVKKHGCPSHGIGLTPDESELWLTDANNQRVHVFDATVMPPVQKTSIKLRDVPGWITFSIDGRFAYPSTGDVIDTAKKRIVATLEDEEGRHVQSEKLLEVVFSGGRPVRVGDQFGVGRKR